MILDVIAENPLLAVVAAGEAGFWVLLGAGLGARYLLRAPTLGALLLASTALVDLAVLVATVFDLRDGGVANWSHGLAATYLGMSVAFGRDLIRWADQRFAHRFAGGPAPERPARHGPQWVRYEWRQWAKFALAWAIACGLMLGMIVLVDAPERTEQLWSWVVRLTIVLVVWFAGWPLRASLTPPVRDGVTR
ncbi:MAG TPA: hypothetical protein VFQ77_05825 [Pseudonocardiaceae bacterium]|nr:hypothetical protein [Pseudonocardiaceae bacterium]